MLYNAFLTTKIEKPLMKKIFIIMHLALILILTKSLYAVEFDELDKPPEGAHKGQMLLGAFLSIGLPQGDFIDAEDKFLKDSTHTFENETVKLIEVSHLSFGFGVSFEYMPFDRVGIKSKLRRTVIVQKTNFGSEYKNWRGYLYRDYALYLGPTIHTTYRKSWDFTLTPVIGYAYGRFAATTIARKTIAESYPGETRKDAMGLSYGAELNFTAYLSRGIFLSIGFEWLRNSISLDSAIEVTNPQTDVEYFDGKSSGNIDTYSIIITSGYAFSN